MEYYPYTWQAEHALSQIVYDHRLHMIIQPNNSNEITHDVSWSPDGTQIAASMKDGSMVVWDATSGEEIISFTNYENGSLVSAFTWSPDSTQLLIASDDGAARIWDAASGKQLFEFVAEGEMRTVSYSPDMTHIMTAYRNTGDGTAPIKVWDAATGQEVLTIDNYTDVFTTLNYAQWSPDGTQIASAHGGEDRRVRIWDANTGGYFIPSFDMILFTQMQVGRQMGID